LGYTVARRRPLSGLATICVVLAASQLAAQEPGVLASPTQRLDHLLSTWRGQPVARVREVFGRENATELRGTNPVLVYEKRVKVRAAGIGAVTIHPNGGLRCVVRFEINDAEKVVRVGRQGGGQECWNEWRRYEP
jgi:hypothetical protein